MSSLILQTTTRFVLPLLLLFSVFLVMRGHNEPGGGFVGGLVASASFALYALAFGVPAARTMLSADPRTLIGVGLLLALVSGSIPLVLGKSFMAGLWGTMPIPGLGTVYVGTPVLFDLGVYLAVTGVTLTIILSLAEEPGAKEME